MAKDKLAILNNVEEENADLHDNIGRFKRINNVMRRRIKGWRKRVEIRKRINRRLTAKTQQMQSWLF